MMNLKKNCQEWIIFKDSIHINLQFGLKLLGLLQFESQFRFIMNCNSEN